MAEDEVNENEDAQKEDGEDGEGEDGEEGGGKKKLILIIVGVLVLLGAIGAGLFFTGMIGGSKSEIPEECQMQEGDEHPPEGCEEHYAEKEEEHAEKDGEDHGGDDGHGEKAGGSAFIEIPTMIVNLNTEDGVPRFLRLSVQLELKKPSEAEALQAIIPRVIDRFQSYLRELRVKDLRGSGGIYRLQMELLWRVNQAAAPIEVKDVLFQEILIQ